MHIKIKDFEFISFLGADKDSCSLSYTIEFPNNVERPYVSKSYSGCHVCKLAEKSLSHIYQFIENSVIISDKVSELSNQFQLDSYKKYGVNSPSQEDVREFGNKYRLLTEKLRGEFPLNAEFI
jgi:hypothetical protein